LQYDRLGVSAGSASTKLELLGTIGVPQKRFEALSVLAASSKYVKARRIVTEYSPLLTNLASPGAPNLDGMVDACVWIKRYFIFDGALHRNLGEQAF
jgi:hypothetical protein